jgi:hypothetical protein
MQSLIAIGNDAVVDALDRRFAAAGGSFRERSSFVLENIHTARSAATLLKWLDVAWDEELCGRILQALLAGFVPAAVERARTHLLAAAERDWIWRCVRIQLVALCTLTGSRLPELEQWRKRPRRISPGALGCLTNLRTSRTAARVGVGRSRPAAWPVAVMNLDERR